MSYDLIIEGMLVDPVMGIFSSKVGIGDGRIESIGNHVAGRREIHLSPTYIFPGFVDMHAHLREDSSGEWNYKEDFYTGTMAAAAGGVTTVCDMPNTPRPAISREELLAKRELAKKGVVDVLFYAGVCRENIPELESMQDLVVGYKIFTCESTGIGGLSYDDIDRAVARIANTGKPIVFHCEDPKINERHKDSKSYSASRPIESEKKAIEVVLSITRRYHARAHITHVTSGSSVGMIHEVNETCDATPHHLYFSSRAEDNYLRMNPPLREDRDRRSLMFAFGSGEVSALATDHAPHTKEDKLRGACGVPNLDTYGAFASALLYELHMSPEMIARVTSYAPARILSINDIGRIAEGYRANLTVITPEPDYANGPYQTKCGWSAFDGLKFPGRVLMTIRDGEIVYKDKSGFLDTI